MTQVAITGGSLRVTSVTLTAAQVLAIFTTPITVVPAPGAGLVAVPVYGIFNYTQVTTQYTDGGGALVLQWPGGGGTQMNCSMTTNGFWNQAASRWGYADASRAAVPITSVVNQAVQVKQNTANPTLGDGTVTVTVAYILVAAA